MASTNYNRMGFKEEKQDVKDTMIEEFTSPLVAELRANNGQVKALSVLTLRIFQIQIVDINRVRLLLLLSTNIS